MSIVIDRRLNDRNKSAANRARFLRRYKEQIKKSVTDMVGERSITDMDRGGTVNIPIKDVSEPSFHHGPGGDHESVHTGNHSFRPGDRLPRPSSGGGGKGSGHPSQPGSDTDDVVLFVPTHRMSLRRHARQTSG